MTVSSSCWPVHFARQPIVDSGVHVSCCPLGYSDVPQEPVKRHLRLKSVKNEELQHYGCKPLVQYRNTSGEVLQENYEVTDCSRPVISFRERSRRGQMTVFGPGVSKIIEDPDAIQQIEEILASVGGFGIKEERGA